KEGVPDGVREAAAAALGKIGKDAKDAVDALLNVLSTGRSTLALQAVRALNAIGCADQRFRSALVDLWGSSAHSKNVQIQIASALCKLETNAPGLLRALTSTLSGDP